MSWADVSTLVTGGAGFIGAYLVRHLVKEGAKVTVLDDFSTGSKDSLPVDITLFQRDVSAKDTFTGLGRFDYVFHFAAPSSIVLFDDDPKGCTHSTLCGFLNVFEWAKTQNVKKVVYPSSGSVYGNIDPPHRETANVRPVNLYGVAKLCTEHIARQYPVKSLGLRIFAGYGLGEERKGKAASVVTLFLNSILRGEPPVIFGDGTQQRDYVYIEDVAEAILKAALSDFTGILNVGTGRSHSLNELVEMLSRILKKNIQPRYVPKPTSYLEHTQADTQLMEAVLGFRPLNIEEGLRRYATALAAI